MRKNIYEVFDEFAKVDSKQDKISKIIGYLCEN